MQDEFETLLENFKLNLDKMHENNSFMTVVLGDFNSKPDNCAKLTPLPFKALILML